MTDLPKNSGLNTIEHIFTHNSGSPNSKKFTLPKRNKEKIKELELALAVILVDLASVDQNFEPTEYQVILTGLRRMFGATREQVQALVNQATLIIKNLRGTSRYSQLLRDNLEEEERNVIMEIINEVIGADEKLDGFEVYFRQRLASALNVKVETQKPPKTVN